MAIAEAFVTDTPAGGGDWRAAAVCKGRPDLFFARRAERPEARYRREAKAAALCDSCPVRVDCRQYARTHHEYGFWGGESEEQRHRAGFRLAAPIGIRADATRLPR